MQFAIVDEARNAPEPRLKGRCPVCGRPVLAKCGERILWHWAHEGERHCDVWWENETPWHRAWKSCFPEKNREIVHFDHQSGERHVADVKTGAGVVLEFQNSPMPIAELRAREQFYGRMLWIVNGESFQFSIGESLPHPDCAFAQDIVFYPEGRIFWRPSENPHVVSGQDNMVYIHRRREIEDDIQRHYVGHHCFDWVRPRTVWFEATAPVYFDFGDDMLYHLQRYRQQFLCIQYITGSEQESDGRAISGSFPEDDEFSSRGGEALSLQEQIA